MQHLFEPLVNSLFLVILLSAIPLGSSLIVGLIVSVFQAATQIQEMTLTFVPKLLTVAFILFLFGGWMGQQLVDFLNEMLKIAAELSRG